MARIKLHFFCDNVIGWTGAEQMLVCLFGSKAMQDSFDLSFSYHYSKRFYDGMFKWFDIAGVKKYPVSYPLNYIANKYLKYLTFYLTAWKIGKALKAFRPDILHIHNGGFPGAMGCNAAVFAGGLLRPKPKMVYFTNNVPKQRGLIQRWSEKGIDKLVAKNVDVFLSGSKCVQEELFYTLQDDSLWPKMKSIPTTIHPNQSAFSRNRMRFQCGVQPSDVLIVSVGVLEKRKGHIHLVKAFRELMKREGRKVHLWIIGEGPGQRYLEDNSHDMVYFKHDTTNSYSYINACDIYVQPSIEHEDFPVSILQAMKLGKPVIGSKVAGIPEQIRHWQDGFIVEPGNENALYHFLLMLTGNKGMRKQMGESAQSRFETEFSYDKIMSKYVEFYKSLI